MNEPDRATSGPAYHDMLSRLVENYWRMNDDERHALVAVSDGIALGATTYGHFDAATDRRDLLEEEAYEWRDAIVYRAFARIARRIRLSK